MILTGKCKEDFIKWVKKRCNIKLHELMKVEMWFSIQDEALKNALIIEFFVCVGIFINVSPNYLDQDRKYSDGDFKAIINFKDGRNTMSVDFTFESCFNPCNRQEATEQAIKKANEIYNSK